MFQEIASSLGDLARQHSSLMREMQAAEEKYQGTLRQTIELQRDRMRGDTPTSPATGGTAAGGFGGMGTANNVKAAADALSKWTRTLSDASLSAGEMHRRLIEGIPVLGDFFRSARELGEAFSGAAESMRQSRFQLALREGIAPREGAIRRTMDAAEIAQAQASADAGMLGRLQSRGLLGGDRSTAIGQRAFDEERFMGASRDALAMAGPRTDAAIMGQGAARRLLDASEGNLTRLNARRDAATGARATDAVEDSGWGLHGWGAWISGRGRAREVKHTTAVLGIDKEIDQEHQRRIKLLDDVKTKNTEVAEAESQARKANIAVLKAELTVLEERDRLLRGQLQAIGGMTRGQRQATGFAIDRIERVGWDAAGPMARQLAMQINPDKANKLAEQAAEASGLMDRLPADWRRQGTREGLDRDIRAKEKEGRDAAIKDVKESAAAYDNVMKRFMADLAAGLADQLKAFRTAFEEQLRAKNVLGG